MSRESQPEDPKRLANRLERSEAELRAILENAVQAIITIDDRGIVQSVNSAAERIFGYAANEVIGHNVKVLMPSPDREQHDQYISDYLGTGNAKIIGIGREVVGQRKDGTTFPMDLAISEVLVGERRLFTGMCRDVSERKQAEAEREQLITELETKAAELERFTYTVSHDLKSPLITIKGFLGLLEKDATAGDAERLQSDIRQISGAADKMRQLLDELLELSRIGRLENSPEHVSVGELAREAVDVVAGQISEGGVQIEIQPDLPVVYGDRPRLVEVLQNLVDNAVKFRGNQANPRVEVGCRQQDDKPVFYVRDNGIGIDPRYHKKVFELFDRLDQEIDGTGIGLTLVKRIIAVHGGRIWIESTGQGNGCTFCFTLPQKEASTSDEQ